VCDAISWTILLDDLEQALGAGPEAAPPATYQAWTAHLAGWAASPAGARALDAAFEEVRPMLAAAAPLPADPAADPAAPAPGALDAGAEVTTVVLELEGAEELAREAWRVHGASLDEVVLAALRATLAEHAGEGVLVESEGHGRRPPSGPGVDVSRTVGWFTAVHPLMLA